MKGSFRRFLQIVTAVIVGVNAITAISVVRTQAELTNARGAVLHTYSVLHEIDGLYTLLARRTASLRGYLLGGGEAFRSRSREANALLAGHIEALRELTEDNPQRQRELGRLDELLEKSTASWRAVVESSDPSSQIARSIDPRSIEVGRDTRILLDDMAADEHRLLDQRWGQESTTAHERVWVAFFMTLLSIASLTLAAMVTLRQLDARERAERELTTRSTLLRTTIESLERGLAVFDAANRLLMWNQRFVALGLMPDGIRVGATVAEVAPEDAARLIADGPPFERAGPKDTAFEVSRRAMPDGGFVATWTDVTARRRIERMKSEFVSTVSHELRTPLTSIIGSLGLVRGGVTGELPAEARELVDIAHKNGERLVRLINDILDVEKIESGRMDFSFQTHDLMSIVRSSIEANAGYAERLTVRFELAGSVDAKVRVDRTRLEQILANLLSNAAKFAPAGSAVEIEVTRTSDGAVRVAVRDHGPGIPEEFQARLFERFSQADSSDARAKGGTGLGLSISRAIVERLGGSIGFATAAGQGTTFFIDLPEIIDADINAAAGAQRRVLICEDDPTMALALARMLTADGFICETAGTAHAALERLRSQSYDLLTLDILLPDRDGLSLLKEVRSIDGLQNLPVIVISAVGGQAQSGLEGDALGIVDWIDKPSDAETLVVAARRAVQKMGPRRLRVIHIEDDADVRQIIARSLGELADVVGVASVADARQAVSGSRFDLAILDLQLPDGLGLSLLPLFSATSDNPVPVIIFSAHETPQHDARQVAAALVKSRTPPERLVSIVREMAGRPAA